MKDLVVVPLISLVTGIIFGLGLAISGMTDPMKVLSFLRIGAGWDPSLLVVMVSALAVTSAGMNFYRGNRPVFEVHFHLPHVQDVDRDLLAGAALFGIGWGLGGLCPGPAVASLGSGAGFVYIFALAFLAGGKLGDVMQARPAQASG